MFLKKMIQLLLTIMMAFPHSLVFAKAVNQMIETSPDPIFEWAAVNGADEYKVILKQVNLDGSTSVKFNKILTNSTSIQASSIASGDLEMDALYRIKIKAVGTEADDKEISFKVIDKSVYVTPMQFLPRSSSDDGNYLLSGGHFRANGSTIDANVEVPLPDGVEISKLEIWYDNAVSQIFDLELRRDGPNLSASQEIATIDCDGDDATNKSTSIIDTTNSRHIVDNDNYVYFCEIDGLDDNSEVHKIKVSYQGEVI